MFLLIQTIDFGALLILLFIIKKIYSLNFLECLVIFFVFKSYLLQFILFFKGNIKIKKILFYRTLLIFIIYIFVYILIEFKFIKNLDILIIVLPLIFNFLLSLICHYIFKSKIKTLLLNLILFLSYHILIIFFILSHGN